VGWVAEVHGTRVGSRTADQAPHSRGSDLMAVEVRA
jgi:hypothetical protein